MNPEKIALIALTSFAFSHLALAETNTRNLCKSNETEIASCQLQGKTNKTLSICASENREAVSYYFGARSKIELNINFSSREKIFRWQDTETYVTFFGFSTNGYSYIFGIPQETVGAKAFLLVSEIKSPFDFNTPRLCTSNSFGNKNLISTAISDVSDSTVKRNEYVFPHY